MIDISRANSLARAMVRRLRGVRRARQNLRLAATAVSLLPRARGERKVVILAPRAGLGDVTPWLPQFAADQVHVLGRGSAPRKGPVVKHASYHRTRSVAEIAAQLFSIGTLDVLLDLRGDTSVKSLRRTWRRLGFNLREGGVYVVVCRDGTAPDSVLMQWARQLIGMGLRRRRNEFDAELTAGALLLPRMLAVVKRGQHFALLNDEEVDRVLPAREPGVSIETYAELPAGVLRSGLEVVSHESGVPVLGVDTEMPYPRMRLRHYIGPLIFGGQTLLLAGRSVLPDSFRFYRADSPSHPSIRRVSPTFGALKRSPQPRETLEGDYFLLDPQYTGHFGHIMTEIPARLWGWDEAKRRLPGLKVLTMVKSVMDPDSILSQLLPAYGIAPSDLVVIDRPVQLTSVVCATAMFHNCRPFFVHPALPEVWKRIAGDLVDPSASVHERIFVSRPAEMRRGCRNVADVEQLFIRYGFAVIRPEQFTLGIQAGIFKQAKIIAGIAGSAMLNLMYTDKLQQLIVLAQEGYSARYEHLYASLLGGRADYFWSAPDIAPNMPGYLASAWEFDFERNRKPLEALLRSL